MYWKKMAKLQSTLVHAVMKRKKRRMRMIFKSDQSGRPEKSSNSEEENLLNIHYSKKRMRVPSDSESEDEAYITRLYPSFDAGYYT